MSAPTYDAILALLEVLGGIAGPAAGYFNDFSGRVYTADMDPAANGEDLKRGGWMVVRWNGEDVQDTAHESDDERAVYPETEIGLDLWLPESSTTPGVSNALEIATKAGLDLLKAVNVVFHNRTEVKSASLIRIVRGTGTPGVVAKLIATLRFSETIDLAAIGP